MQVLIGSHHFPRIFVLGSKNGVTLDSSFPKGNFPFLTNHRQRECKEV